MRNVANPMIGSTLYITPTTTMLIHHLKHLCRILVLLSCIIQVARAGDTDWNWKVIGPFENYSGSAFTKKLDAERPYDTTSHKNGRGGTMQWRDHQTSNTSLFMFYNMNAERYGAYLASTFVESQSSQSAVLNAFFGGTLEIYVNDSLAYNSGRDILTYSTVPIANIRLEKGWNRIVIKAGNNELPFCFADLNITDALGNVLAELASSSEPKLYPKSAHTPEPLTIPDSLYDMGYDWDDSFTDSLLRSFDDKGQTVSGMIQQAVQYKDQGLFTNALEKIRDAVGYCPERYDAWFLKANIHLDMQQQDSAMTCLERGLLLDPGAYGPTSRLRALKQQPNLFSYFTSANTDSIIEAGFKAEPRPTRFMDIILHDERRFVLAGGSSVVETDQIFRISSDVDISLFKEYPVENGLNAVSLSLVDYKYYGDSVVAKQVGNNLILDNIEIGDLIRVRRRFIDRDSTIIPLYYRCRHELQRRFYTHRSRFQIITPLTDKFQWRTYNTMAEPQFAETPVGYHLSWDETKIEPLPVEVDMPRADLTGMIEVSTVPSWEYVAQRYNDAFIRNIGVTAELRAMVDEFIPNDDSLPHQEVIQRIREFFGNLDMTSEPMSYPNCRSIDDIIAKGPKSATDCAVLFISMLAARNIKAYPMIIDTNTTPFHAPPTPSAVFNHVVVVVPGDSLPAFFDPRARPLASYYSLPYNIRGAFGLVIRKGLREPMYVANDPVMKRFTEDVAIVRPREDGTSMIYQFSTTTEQDSSVIRANVHEAEKHGEQMMALGDSIWCDRVTGTNLLRFCRRFVTPQAFIRDTTDTTRLVLDPPWRYSYMFPEAPYDTVLRKTPLLRWSAADSSVSTFIVHAPPGYTFAKNQPKGLFNVESTRYSLISVQQGDSLVVTRKVVLTQPYVTPESYVGFQVSHAKMIEIDAQPIVLIPAATQDKKRKKK